MLINAGGRHAEKEGNLIVCYIYFKWSISHSYPYCVGKVFFILYVSEKYLRSILNYFNRSLSVSDDYFRYHSRNFFSSTTSLASARNRINAPHEIRSRGIVTRRRETMRGDVAIYRPVLSAKASRVTSGRRGYRPIDMAFSW